LIQVTADALTGHKGRHAQQVAHQLLEKRWVHFLASDAHNISTRPPRMREAHDLVVKKYGAAYAYSLCFANPMAAYLGKEVEAEEKPRGLEPEIKVPGLWQRLTERFTRS